MANTWTTLLDAVYPVGSVYVSWSSTSPATLFGGTWTNINGERYLALVDTSNTAGTSVGANSVTLSTAQIPKHNHSGSSSWLAYWGTAGSGDVGMCSDISKGQWGCLGNSSATFGNFSNNVGSGSSHENRPLSYYCYGWRRTA